MKNKLKNIALVSAIAFGLSACGESVEVPLAFKGKIITKDGVTDAIIEPSKFRLSPCWAYCDKLLILESSDVGVKESFTVFMPKDQLKMSFDLRMTATIRDDQKTLNSVFSKIPASREEEYYASGRIAFVKVYDTYAKPIVRSITRSVLAKYTIDQVASNRKIVNSDIAKELNIAMKKNPILLKFAELADVNYPDIITKQKELAAQRRIDIEKEEANKQVIMVKLQTDLETAKVSRTIKLLKAQTALEENRIISKSATKEYLAYRDREVLEQMAKNKNVVFFPVGSLNSIGLQNRMFNK